MIFSALKRVFGGISYIVLAGLVSLSIFFISIFSPNRELVGKVFFSANITLPDKLNVFTSLVGGIKTSVLPLSAFTIVGVAILFGINFAMLLFMIRRNRQAPQKLSGSGGVFSSLGGIVSGALGIGCAACGSLVLLPILAFFGATWFLAFLPLGGSEFGFLAMILISFSIYWLAKKINDPLVCPAS